MSPFLFSLLLTIQAKQNIKKPKPQPIRKEIIELPFPDWGNGTPYPKNRTKGGDYDIFPHLIFIKKAIAHVCHCLNISISS